MKESPNKDNPQADVEFIVQELLDLFNGAQSRGIGVIELDDNELHSMVGSRFHSRVLNAAKHLGLIV